MWWTKEQRNKFAENLITTSKMYGSPIDFDVARMIVDDLQDLDYEKCLNALVIYRRDDKNKFWPRAASIRAIVSPEIDKRAVAVEISRKIDKAIGKHGWNWSEGMVTYNEAGEECRYWLGMNGNTFFDFKEAVISEVGVIGWHAIQSRGGWNRVRDSANQMDEGMFIAQMREQINSSMTLAESGIDLIKLEMPKPQEIGNILNLPELKKLEKK